MKRIPVFRFNLAAASLMGLCAFFMPSPVHAATSCNLRAQGECCNVTISPGHDAAINTAIDTAAQRDYVLILSDNKGVCVFQYDGAFQSLMQIGIFGYKATWMGEPATLRYQADSANTGACHLMVYYMTEGYDKFPTACNNGKYTPALASYNKPPQPPSK